MKKNSNTHTIKLNKYNIRFNYLNETSINKLIKESVEESLIPKIMNKIENI